MKMEVEEEGEGEKDEPKYIAFLSGIEIGNEAYNSLKTQLLFEYLTGELGCIAVKYYEILIKLIPLILIFNYYINYGI